MTNYKPSETLIEHIMKTEGVRLEAYRCPAGVWTIGCGHTKGVKQGDRITEAQVRQLLMDDLKEPLRYVNALGVCRTQGQADALVDFAFNCGTGALGTSTLLLCIRHGKSLKDIVTEFLRWTRAQGKDLDGLVKRRLWEALRWTQ